MSSSRRPFQCSSCSKNFTRAENLERHKASAHTEDTRKPFACPHCTARFSRRDVRKRHSDKCGNPSNRRLSEIDTTTIPSDETCFPLVEIPILMDNSENPNSASLYSSNGNPSSSTSRPSPAQSEPFEIPTPTADTASASMHIAAYFEYFHPALPILHRATFDASSVPKSLVDIVTIIGSLYSAHSNVTHNSQLPRLLDEVPTLWQRGLEDLQNSVSEDCREIRKPFLMQSCILHIVYGAFMHKTIKNDRTRSMLRVLVDAVRDLGLLKQYVAISNPQMWYVDIRSNGSQRYTEQLNERWKSYIDEESLKLSVYILFLLDHHILTCSNNRSLLSPLEFCWDLPLAASLWDAGDAVTWQQRIYDEYGMTAVGFVESPVKLPRHLSTDSLSVATQSLMSDTPDVELIDALSASPAASMCILTNLDALVKEFTRSYYQMPPSPADPSAYHILTQSQNRRVLAAVRVMSDMVERQAALAPTELEPSLWRTCQILIWSVKFSLSRPDDLLVGGIAESRVFASLLTATHLTTGSYVPIKRMTHALKQRYCSQDTGDDSIIAMLDDLTSALISIASPTPGLALREPPWTVAASYRILLVIWGALRQAISNTREKLENLPATGPSQRVLGSSYLIFNTITDIVLQYEWHRDTPIKRARLWATDPCALNTALAESEETFMNLLIQICKHKPVWTIGPSMAAVVGEMVAARTYL